VTPVELRFPPAAEYVRTARLVAVAVARRAGLADQLEEIRLAVGEACARAVQRCLSVGCTELLIMTVDDSGPDLIVTVTDGAGTDVDPQPLRSALLEGLADNVKIRPYQGICGAQVYLEWYRQPGRPAGGDRARIPDQGPF